MKVHIVKVTETYEGEENSSVIGVYSSFGLAEKKIKDYIDKDEYLSNNKQYFKWETHEIGVTYSDFECGEGTIFSIKEFEVDKL